MQKLILLATLSLFSFRAFTQSTAFTYQGCLNNGESPANGNYDLRFALYDSTNNPGSGGTTLMRRDSSGNLYPTSAINTPSDRHVKRDFAPVDGREILERLARVTIQNWTYASDVDGPQPVGPVAQDFQTVFGLGADDKDFATVDADGVALSALRIHNQSLEKRLERLEKLLGSPAR